MVTMCEASLASDAGNGEFKIFLAWKFHWNFRIEIFQKFHCEIFLHCRVLLHRI